MLATRGKLSVSIVRSVGAGVAMECCVKSGFSRGTTRTIEVLVFEERDDPEALCGGRGVGVRGGE